MRSASLAAQVKRHLMEAGSPLTHACVTAAVRAVSGSTGGEVGSEALVQQVTHALRTELIGSAAVNALLDDACVTDVLINGSCGTWVDRGNGLQRVALPRCSDAESHAMTQRLAVACGQRLDEAKPWVDARLPDGTRLHVVIAPIATDGVNLSLRTFRPRMFTLGELVENNCLHPRAAQLLRAILAAKLTFLVTGGTNTGKTTFLASLLGELPSCERVVVVEDSQELRCNHPHVISLQARIRNAEGAGSVSLRDLVRQALRMRPDRIIVGECRGAEVVELLCALNTGHDGCAGTLHANSPADVPARLEALGALGGLDRAALHSQLAASVHCVLHMRRHGARRVLEEIALLRRDGGGTVEAATAWALDGRPTAGYDALESLLADRALR
ncbi:MAG: TadA family conjugal transfer-associated ATPase [Mycobacteriales bacterium]